MDKVSRNPRSVFPLRGVLPGGQPAVTAATFTQTFFPPSHLMRELITCAQVLASPIVRAVSFYLSSAPRAGPGVEQMLGEDAQRRHSHLAAAGQWGTGERSLSGKSWTSTQLLAAHLKVFGSGAPRGFQEEPRSTPSSRVSLCPSPSPNTRTPQKMLSSHFHSTKPEPLSLCGAGVGGWPWG